MLRRAVVVAACVLVVVFGLQSPSMADEDYYFECSKDWSVCQTGVKVAGPQGVCMTAIDTQNTQVCVDYDGDYVYVRDGQADGYAAQAGIDYTSTVLHRHCRNNHGYGTWARCNFDWNESETKLVRGGFKYNYDLIMLENLWTFANN
ncbi:hypothetical protein AB0A73_21450 [Glycomyces sp. NPDC047369]